MQFNAQTVVDTMFENDIWSIPEGIHEVTFADGNISMSHKQIIHSHYYWRMFRDYPGAPMLMEHAITEMYTADTHLGHMAKVFNYVLANTTVDRLSSQKRYTDKRSKKVDDLRWRMSETAYKITNDVYNMQCTRISEYVTSVCAYDLLEIYFDPRMVEARRVYHETLDRDGYADSVVEGATKLAHAVVVEVLYGDVVIPGNGVRKLTRPGIVNRGQVVQLMGPRGNVSDSNGTIFPYPISNGYFAGMDTNYASATESRSATRALCMTTGPLQDSEYFNRRMQLLNSTVDNIEHDTCKGFVTLPILVGSDDAQLLRGKYHMVNDVPVLLWEPEEIHALAGTVIEMRSMTGCGNKDVQTVCKTCLGWAHNIIPPGTNLGFALTAEFCKVLSQLMLSTKHYESSVYASDISLSDTGGTWLQRTKVDPSKLMVKRVRLKRSPVVRLPLSAVGQLNKILTVDVSDLPASRITECKSVAFTTTDKNGDISPFWEEFDLSLGGTGVHLSTEALTFLKLNGWRSNTNHIEFSLEGWDPKHPLFRTPRRGDNIQMFLKEFVSFIMPAKESERSITEFRTRSQALSELVSLSRTRLSFNIVQIEVFIRSCMVVSKTHLALPHPSQDFVFVSSKDILRGRNLSTMLAYEGQYKELLDPKWYDHDSGMRGMLDNVIVGGAVEAKQ